MFPLANGTGGFVIRDASELPGGLEKIAQEQGEYYVISYTPPDSKEDVCHALKVKVDRGGTTVRARSSYCTGMAQSPVTAKTGETDLEKRAAGAQSGSITASVELPFFYTSPGVARVNLAIDIPPGAIPFEKRSTGLHADVNVCGHRFHLRWLSRGPLYRYHGARFQRGRRAIAKAGALREAIQNCAGRVQVLAFIRGGRQVRETGADADHRALADGQLALSGLALSSELGDGSGGNAPSGAGLLDDRTPLKVNGGELVPSGADVFDKSGKAYCYLEVYTTTAPTLDVG